MQATNSRHRSRCRSCACATGSASAGVTAEGAGTTPSPTPNTATAWNSSPFIACIVPTRTASFFFDLLLSGSVATPAGFHSKQREHPRRHVGKVDRRDFMDNVPVEAEVRVDRDVAEPTDLPPWNVREPAPHVVAEARRRLADHAQLAQDCVPQDLVIVPLPVTLGEPALDHARVFDNVGQVEEFPPGSRGICQPPASARPAEQATVWRELRGAVEAFTAGYLLT